MNAILLAGACAGALMVFLTTPAGDVADAIAELQRGSMTHDISFNATTGQVDETSVIAFLD